MSKEGRIRRGKNYLNRIEKGLKVPKQVTKEHQAILEYKDSQGEAPAEQEEDQPEEQVETSEEVTEPEAE